MNPFWDRVWPSPTHDDKTLGFPRGGGTGAWESGTQHGPRHQETPKVTTLHDGSLTSKEGCLGVPWGFADANGSPTGPHRDECHSTAQESSGLRQGWGPGVAGLQNNHLDRLRHRLEFPEQ